MMDDLISRQALCEYALNQKDKSITPNDIMRFPSAQTEKRTEERTETHACDLIDRQALMKEFSDFVRASNNSDFARTPTWNDAVLLVGYMPSAQAYSKELSFTHKALDTISRQDAIDAIYALQKDGCIALLDCAVDEVKNLPSAQPEIIRCKECVYADKNYHCDYMTTWNYGDCFCSYGKRRNDG